MSVDEPAARPPEDTLPRGIGRADIERDRGEHLPRGMLAGVLAGDRRAIAQAITRIENADSGADDLVRALEPHRGKASVLGITGPPGAGKSTLINALLGELVRRELRIAVVAVDPSSPITGGAVLGDRVRMGEHGAHERVFIRSVSSRGHMGGLSRTTGAVVDVFDAAGFDVVIVETVGAGQSEVEITALADARIVVCPPGLGDDVQAIKAGILEIADIFVVNKGDLPAAQATMRDLSDMLRLRRRGRQDVAVLKTVATRGEGIARGRRRGAGPRGQSRGADAGSRARRPCRATRSWRSIACSTRRGRPASSRTTRCRAPSWTP